MAKILVLESSAHLEKSFSRKLVAEFVELLKAQNRGHEFVFRDLAHDPIPVVDSTIVDIIRTPPDKLTDEQRQKTALSEQLIAELKDADYVVIGAGMYNRNVPAALKAWIDQVVRIGMTFTVGENGLEGLLKGKPVLAVLSRGGDYSERESIDWQKPYLEHILGLIGLDVRFAVMEGALMPEEKRDANLARAREAIREAAAKLA
jgi:FMN-dependent NADH-azoreductase